MDKSVNMQHIQELWSGVTREGTPDLIEFLSTSDFFEAPCSTKYHLAVPGGLAQHSLNVYDLLWEKMRRYDIANLDREGYAFKWQTAIICGLGHDLCKVNSYVPGTRAAYKVEDKFPFGHGEKSVSILQDFIKLTPEEKLAIRWHMCAWDASIHFDYPNGFAYREACKRSPLVTLLFTADYEASNVVEAEA